MVNTAVDFSTMERFLLQPNKSVILNHLCAVDKRLGVGKEGWAIYDEPIPVVTEAKHMGILRSHCTQESAVAENIKKARRSCFGRCVEQNIVRNL